MSQEERFEWKYVPSPSLPAIVAAQADDIEKEVDDVAKTTKKSFTVSLYQYQGSSEESGNVVVDFLKKEINLPQPFASKHSIAPQVKGETVRYSTLVREEEEEEKFLVLLSLWKSDEKILNLFFRLPTIKESLVLVNAFQRLSYDNTGGGNLRPSKFTLVHYGMAKVEQEDDTDKEKPDESSQKTPEKEMFYMLDPESLSLYDHRWSETPVIDLRFYLEASPFSIDMIFVCNVSKRLELTRGNVATYVTGLNKEKPDSDPAFVTLKDLLKGEITPKPKEIFKDGKKFDNHLKEKKKPSAAQPGPSSSYRPPAEPTPGPSGMSGRSSGAATAEPMDLSGDSERRQDPLSALQDGNWFVQLISGSHLANPDDALKMDWETKDAEKGINEAIISGNIPEANMDSGGLSPTNFEHLHQCIRNIRGYLREREFTRAIAHLRGMYKVFNTSEFFSPLKEITDEFELLRRIFFLVEN